MDNFFFDEQGQSLDYIRKSISNKITLLEHKYDTQMLSIIKQIKDLDMTTNANIDFVNWYFNQPIIKLFWWKIKGYDIQQMKKIKYGK